MLSYRLKVMQLLSASGLKSTYVLTLIVFVLAGCGGGGGQESFSAPLGVSISSARANESSSVVAGSLNTIQSSAPLINSLPSSSFVGKSSVSSKSKSLSFSSSSASSSLPIGGNRSSSSLLMSSTAASLNSSLKASSSKSPTNSSRSASLTGSSQVSFSSNVSMSSLAASQSSSLRANSSISSVSSSSLSHPTSLSSSSQSSRSFALSDINFQLQAPTNLISDVAGPVFEISNVDSGDLVILYSANQCNSTDESGRGTASSSRLSLAVAKPLSFGVYTFYISVKKGAQAVSTCLPLNVTYTYIPSASAYINVKDYGAKGDGLNDDTQEINAAFVAAKSAGKSIYFPAGTYLCNEKSSPDNKSLILNAGGLNNIAVFGDGDSSHITSSINSKVTLLYIYAYAKSTNLHIFNLKFSNTHSPAPAEYQYGLFLQGTGGQNFSDIKVSNITFSGFGGALQGQGIKGLEIDRNRFLSPRGHDESVYGSTPAVNIWLFENTNGLCEDVKIHHNFADGFSSSLDINSTISKRAMDGFVYGYAYGMDIYENTTQNFIEEHYAIAFPVVQPLTTATISIHNNLIYAAIKADSFLDNGSAKKSNYGVRSDASHVAVEGNTIFDYTLGILVRTFDNPMIAAKDITIKNNQLSSAKDASRYTMSSAIYVIGNTTYPLDNLDIAHNSITMNISPALQVYSAVLVSNTGNSSVHDNEINQDFVNFSSNQLIGRNYSKVTTIIDFNNSVMGIDILPFKKLTGDTIIFQ